MSVSANYRFPVYIIDMFAWKMLLILCKSMVSEKTVTDLVTMMPMTSYRKVSPKTLFYLESHIVHDNIGDFIIKLVHT